MRQGAYGMGMMAGCARMTLVGTPTGLEQQEPWEKPKRSVANEVSDAERVAGGMRPIRKVTFK